MRTNRFAYATSVLLALAALLLWLARPQPPHASIAAPAAQPQVVVGTTGDAITEDQAPSEADEYDEQFLAACLRVKDQHNDVREWLAYHRHYGVGKVYLFDNGSDPPMNETIQDHIASGFVHYEWTSAGMPDTPEAARLPQLATYTAALRRFGNQHRFMAFVDADEFLVLTGPDKDIPALLRRMESFERFGALVAHWVIFGSSNHTTRPEGGVLQSYRKCMPKGNDMDVFVKSIVNTAYATRAISSHNFKYSDKKYAVDEHFQRTDGRTNGQVTTDYIAVYHYATKSREDFEEKNNRGGGMKKIPRGWAWFHKIDRASTSECLTATELGPFV